MALLARKKILLAKIETTYGTDPTPTGAANAIQTSDLSITPLAGPTVSRNLDRAALGNDLQIQVGTFVQLTFAVEFAGSGTVDTPPAYGPLLEMCGFGETINASTNVIYAPISTSIESGTLYFHHDGQLHSMLGARGSVALDITPGVIPKFNFSFTGLYVTPTSTADPTPTLSAFQVPVPVNNTNMTTFALHGSSVTMTACQLDIANNVVYRNVVGNESVEIIDRAPAGSVSFEAPPLSTKNWFTTAQSSTTGAFAVTHGTVAGNTVSLLASSVQVVSPTYGESDGISTIDASLSFVPSAAGNDEISIITA